jgi:hypothetical protein
MPTVTPRLGGRGLRQGAEREDQTHESPDSGATNIAGVNISFHAAAPQWF